MLGEFQLVNDVLMSVHGYWAEIFILPNSGIKKSIKGVCRSFLCFGNHFCSKGDYVTWSELCSVVRKQVVRFQGCKKMELS